jgi:acetyl esterase/lipase
MKFLVILGILILPGYKSVAQIPVRYRTAVFSDVTRKKNIFYGEDSSAKRKSHLLDIYEPAGDTLHNRPVIVLMHGGGFKFGSKNTSRMRIWGKHFAKKGYVCAAINYRLSSKNPLRNFEDLAESCQDASDDAISAVKYLKAHVNDLNIDSSRVILAGHSAGGMIALQNVYGSKPELNRLIKKDVSETSDSKHNPAGIVAIINFWGAIYDTAWLANARVPVVSVHGSKDRVVPYDFKIDNPLFGSAAIHRNADRLRIPNALKTFPGMGHELQKHFIPVYAGPVARKRWRSAADFAADFLYDQLFSTGLVKNYNP